MYDDDGSRYYYEQWRQTINAVIQRAYSGGSDPTTKALRRMMGLDRHRGKGTGGGAQQERHKDAPRT